MPIGSFTINLSLLFQPEELSHGIVSHSLISRAIFICETSDGWDQINLIEFSSSALIDIPVSGNTCQIFKAFTDASSLAISAIQDIGC